MRILSKRTLITNLVALATAQFLIHSSEAWAGTFVPGDIFIGGAISDSVEVLDPVTEQTKDSFTNAEQDGVMSVAVTSGCNTFAVSALTQKVLQYNCEGDLINSFDTPVDPTGLTIGPNGTLFVSIFGDLDLETFVNVPDNRIIEYTITGEELQTITHPALLGPAGIAFDKDGNLYVTASNTAVSGAPGQGIFVFDPNGALISTITNPLLDGPIGIDHDSSGNIFVSNFHTDSVLVFSPDGALISTIQHPDLSGPTYLVKDNEDNLYVSSLLNDSLLLFDTNGSHINTFTSGIPDGPYGVAIKPPSVPEPSSILGLLALGTLGAASTLKRKLKPSNKVNSVINRV